MRKSSSLIFFAFLFLLFHKGYSQNSVNFSAYLDTYYAYDFSQPAGNQRFYVTQYDRHNEFNINHAWIKGAYSQGKVRANLALQTGTYPINNYGAEPSDLLRMIYEANAGYKVSAKSWIDIGVFGGHFGYESALALNRELLSPALSTEYTPYYQTGIRYTNQFSEKLTLRAVVLNGWQNIAETNNSKSFGVAVDYQLNDLLWLSYGNYFGNEATGEMSRSHRFHNNLILKVTPGNRLSLTGIIDHTIQQGGFLGAYQVFFGTLISNYSLTEQISVATRYEFVKDEGEVLIINAVNQGAFSTHIVSLAANFQPEKNISLKLEPKYYFTGMDTFGGPEMSVANMFTLQAGVAILIEEGLQQYD